MAGEEGCVCRYLTRADTQQFITQQYLLGVSKPYGFKLVFSYILLINALH